MASSFITFVRASVDFAMISAIELIPGAGGDLPHAAPAGLSASAITTRSFTLSWLVPADDTGVASYDIFRNGALVGSTTTTSFAVQGLPPYSTNRMTVRARDTAGNGSLRSAPLLVKTLDDGTVGFDVILDNTDKAGVAFTGAWPTSTFTPGYHGSNYAQDANAGKGAKSARFTPDFPNAGTYTIFLRWTAEDNRANNVPVDLTHAGGTTTVVVNQRINNGTWFRLGTFALAAGTANHVVLRTDGTNGFVIADAVRFVREGADTLAPSSPQGLAAGDVGPDALTLTWSASLDNVGVIGYDVFRDGLLAATPTATSATLTGLSPSTSYSLTVRARDAAGNVSAASTAVTVTTDAAAGGGSTGRVISVNLDVYVYWGGRTPQESVPATMAVSFQLWTGSAWVTGATTHLRDTNRSWDGTFNESTATTAAAAVDGEEYVVFRNVSAERFRVSVTSGNRTGLSGFQIVERVSGPQVDAPAVTSAPSASGVYGTPFTYAITANGNPAAHDASGLPSGLQINTTTGLITDVPAETGTFTVALSVTGPGGTTTAPLTLTVAGAAQSIAFGAPPRKTYGDAPFRLVAATSSGLPVSFARVSGPATLPDDEIALTGAGTVTILASQPGNASFAAAEPLTVTFAVLPAAQTLTFPNPGAQTFGTAPLALAAQASSGLAVTYLVMSGPASIDGASVTLTGAGTVTLRGAQHGDANHLAAEPVDISFVVAKASATLTLSALWQYYDGQPKPVVATSTATNTAVNITYDGAPTAPTFPGSYEVRAAVADPNYTASATGTLVVAAPVLVRHAPTLNGQVDGSVQVLAPENIALNSRARLVGDLLLPGSPTLRRNGPGEFAGLLDAAGEANPTTAVVTLNRGSVLRHPVRRVDPVALPAAVAPAAPSGNRDVVINQPGQSIGTASSLRNLTLNRNAGTHAMPPGAYGAFTLDANSGLVLGVAGSTEPAVYHLQRLTLNSQSAVDVIGPVVLIVAHALTVNGAIGSAEHPERLLLHVVRGGVTLNSAATLHGTVDAPAGTVAVNGGAVLTGGVTCDRLVVNDGGRLTALLP